MVCTHMYTQADDVYSEPEIAKRVASMNGGICLDAEMNDVRPATSAELEFYFEVLD